jgi:hypothetical protein
MGNGTVKYMFSRWRWYLEAVCSYEMLLCIGKTALRRNAEESVEIFAAVKNQFLERECFTIINNKQGV